LNPHSSSYHDFDPVDPDRDHDHVLDRDHANHGDKGHDSDQDHDRGPDPDRDRVRDFDRNLAHAHFGFLND
jgi:hypothetical protein